MGFMLPVLVALALAVVPADVLAGGHGGSHSSGSHSSSKSGHASSGSRASNSHHSTSHAAPSRRATGVQRNSHGKIKRNPEQRAKFMRSHPCPSTGKTHGACPGYVVDHLQALKHGGRDDPSNMQWQSKEAARAKDKWE